MSKKRTFYRILLFLTLLIILVPGISACGQKSPEPEPVQPASEPTGEIASTPLTVLSIVGGDVLVMKPGGQWTRGEAGMTLEVSDRIKTETGGQATITFFEGSTVELDGDTEISLAELDMAGTASTIRLKQDVGKTISRVKKLIDPASRYEVETAAALAAVRGTTMSVDVDEDGVTVVGNIEGLVSVIARGVEVELPQGTRSTIVPGESPGQPQLETPPPTSSAPAGTPTPEPEPTPSITPTPDIVRISIGKTCNRQTAFPGDTLTYTYTAGNAGDVPLSDISVTDDKAGPAVYMSGDTDTDNMLDIDETWIFSADYAIQAGEIGQLKNTAVASGTGPDNQKATASATAVVNVSSIIVKITSLQEGETVGRSVVVSGTVNDPSITQGVLTVNDKSSDITITDGQFTSTVSLDDGVNNITVTVTKAGGITASASVKLEPVEPP